METVKQLRYNLELFAQRLADFWLMLVPRARPSRQALIDCMIISHRGEHDNRKVRENTLTAFDLAAQAGVGGLEFDVRWTRDLQPVVIHDADTRRVFGRDLVVAEVSLAELREQLEEIPTLAEVVERYGKSNHLMIELKPDELGQEEARTECLREIFAPLQGVTDYHFLALELDLFRLVEFAGYGACLPVAELNIGELSRQALERGMAGVSGQYLLMNSGMIRRHHLQGQKVGTGFAASRFCLYRELNRGVDWVFTNHALKLCKIRQQLLSE
jgi:glycerophosphoryl diester phosphodiesterase